MGKLGGDVGPGAGPDGGNVGMEIGPPGIGPPSIGPPGDNGTGGGTEGVIGIDGAVAWNPGPWGMHTPPYGDTLSL